MILLNFDRFHFLHKAIIEGLRIFCVVGSPMAGGAQANDKTRIIRSPIAQTPEVMRFKIRLIIRSTEGRGLFASLAIFASTGENIVTNITAPLKDRTLDGDTLWCGLGGGERTIAQFLKINSTGAVWLFGSYELVNILHATKLEDNRIPHVILRVGRSLVVMTFIDHFTFKPNPVRQDREEKDGLAALPRLDDREIAIGHLHIVDLALAKVFENSIVAPSVVIAVRMSFLASEDENQGVCSGRYDSTALLSIETSMDVLPAIIYAADLKSVRQSTLPEKSTGLIDCKSCGAVKEALQ